MGSAPPAHEQAPECAGKILVVDDEEINRELLSSLLSVYHYDVVEAEDGETALELAAAAPPDTVLLDVMMPGLDGFEVCRRLKADPATAAIPVLLVTALSERKDRLTGIKAGANDFLTKPIDSQDVVLRVRNAVHAKRLYDQVRESYERLCELEQLRDNLTHMIVHDLRSPLTGLYGHLQLLEMSAADKLDDEDQKDLQNALTSATALIDMVSSLLDVSRLESGKMPLRPREFDIAPLVDDAIGTLGAMVQKCNVTWEQPPERFPAFCDPDVTRRIIANLLGNALKFTPERGDVTVLLEGSDAGPKLCVIDSGPGIPKEFHGKIFEKFGQADIRQTGTKYSTGLGLTFCKLAVEAQGGTIGVESEPGQGSVFWFALPREPLMPERGVGD